MDNQVKQLVEDNWFELVRFLPSGWKEKARELKAQTRSRAFADVEILLRVLLIHLAMGYSLRVTAAMAHEANLAKLSDVALLKRLNKSGDWFLWMAQELRNTWVTHQFGTNLDISRLRAVDGTTVQEPGATGTTWRIHYSLSLSTLHCDEVYVTSPKKGESFKNFIINENDILIADRIYSTPGGIRHVLDNKGHVISRYMSSVPIYDDNNNKIDLLHSLKKLKIGAPSEWVVNILYENRPIQCRLCAIKKAPEAAAREKNKILREASKKGRTVKPETLEFAEYIIVLTTLDRKYSCASVLEAYRQRWQVELAFKRLKSLVQLGHLKKYDEEGAKAWIHGKLFLAMLIEAFIRAGEAFFPWGYPTVAEAS